MKTNKSQLVEIKLSKNNLEVPIADGVLLHSIYDPIREAHKFTTQNAPIISKNTKFLIFGSGYGYHINAIINKLKESKINDFEIYVIEPNVELFNKYSSSKQMLNDKRIVYLVGKTPNQLYKIDEFVDFLLAKPAVLPHTASFNLNEQYFTEFLTYNAPNCLGDYIENIHDSGLKDYLKQFPIDIQLKEISNKLSKVAKDEYVVEDFILLAFNELQKTSRLL